jgi:hypothetical protein
MVRAYGEMADMSGRRLISSYSCAHSKESTGCAVLLKPRSDDGRRRAKLGPERRREMAVMAEPEPLRDRREIGAVAIQFLERCAQSKVHHVPVNRATVKSPKHAAEMKDGCLELGGQCPKADGAGKAACQERPGRIGNFTRPFARNCVGATDSRIRRLDDAIEQLDNRLFDKQRVDGAVAADGLEQHPLPKVHGRRDWSAREPEETVRLGNLRVEGANGIANERGSHSVPLAPISSRRQHSARVFLSLVVKTDGSRILDERMPASGPDPDHGSREGEAVAFRRANGAEVSRLGRTPDHADVRGLPVEDQPIRGRKRGRQAGYESQGSTNATSQPRTLPLRTLARRRPA